MKLVERLSPLCKELWHEVMGMSGDNIKQLLLGRKTTQTTQKEEEEEEVLMQTDVNDSQAFPPQEETRTAHMRNRLLRYRAYVEIMKEKYKSQMCALQEEQQSISGQLEKLDHKTSKEMKNMMLWFIP